MARLTVVVFVGIGGGGHRLGSLVAGWAGWCKGGG